MKTECKWDVLLVKYPKVKINITGRGHITCTCILLNPGRASEQMLIKMMTFVDINFSTLELNCRLNIRVWFYSRLKRYSTPVHLSLKVHPGYLICILRLYPKIRTNFTGTSKCLISVNIKQLRVKIWRINTMIQSLSL